MQLEATRRPKTFGLVLGLSRVTGELGMESVCAGLFGVGNSQHEG